MEHFFKSSFARSFITNCRDSKSLDYELLDNTTAVDAEPNGNINNNFFSLMNLDEKSIAGNEDNVWKMQEVVQTSADANELEKLRKQCHSLAEENRRLQNALTDNQVPHVQVIDNVFLQTQVETLQWQLKQTEANKQMYRSLMEQVVRFLDRARKSLDILHEKNNPKDKNSASRVPRSRSVHAVHGDASPKNAPPTSSSASSSRFTRAKSVTQISPSTTSYRDFTWSMLRRNDPAHCTPPRKSQDQKIDGVVYRRPKQPELDPNEVPPEKLSQEAFRLMRTVQSLLSMREPELARISSMENGDSSPSPTDHHRHNNDRNDVSLSLQSSFMNSLSLQDSAGYARRSCSDRGNESSSTDNDSRSSYAKSSNDVNRSLFPGVRRSLDATSLNSGSSKTTEEEDVLANNNNSFNMSIPDHEGIFTCTPSATPSRRVRKVEKKEKEKCSKSKPAASVSSVEDESGFSSMSSFQEIGLPQAVHISPIRGYHTEVGLPEVPLDKGKHRRWSSTPAEIQAMINKQRNSFATSQTANESLSVWV